MRRSATSDEIIKILKAAGIDYTRTPTGSGHVRFRWTINGKPRTYVTPASRTDWHAPLNARRDVRRILRQDGIVV